MKYATRKPKGTATRKAKGTATRIRRTASRK